MLQACLNGGRAVGEHPAVPLSPDELAGAAAAAGAAGASSLHVHPRGGAGRESLDAEVVGAAVAAIRRACPGVPLGVTTGAWIEPDPERRRARVAAWRIRPDFASVNFSEPGAVALCPTLDDLGVGGEAGLRSVDDAERFVAAPPRVLRILVEAPEPDPGAGAATALAIERALDGAGGPGAGAPRLVHGQEAAAWPILVAALRRGRDVRIGLEDVLVLPDGRPARDNAELVAAAAALVGA